MIRKVIQIKETIATVIAEEAYFPVAEAASEQVCSLPLFPDMTPQDAEDVIAAVKEVVAANG